MSKAIPGARQGRGRAVARVMTVEFRQRMALLPEDARRLLQMRLEERLSFREIAAIECETIAVAHKRVTRLLARCSDPGVIELTRHPEAFDPRHWQLAIRALLGGQSTRCICREMKVPRRLVVAAVAAARAWCAARRSAVPACPAPEALRQPSPAEVGSGNCENAPGTMAAA